MTPYKFFIRKDAATYYYVDPDITSGAFGTVQTDASATTQCELKGILPDWGQLGFNYKRHEAYFGITQKYTPDKVRFARDAAVILKYIKNTYDVDGDAELEIHQLDHSTGTYTLLDVFKIDLFKHESYPLSLDAPIVSGGIEAIVDKFDETPYEIELNDPSGDAGVEWAYMNGVIIKGKYNYQMPIAFGAGHHIASMAGGATTKVITHGLIFINREGEYEVGVTNPAVLKEIDLGAAFPDSFFFRLVMDNTDTFIEINGLSVDYQFFESGGTYNHNLSLKVKFFDETGADLALDLPLWSSNGGAFVPVSGSTSTEVVPDILATVPGGIGTLCHYGLFLEYTIDNPLAGGDTASFDYSPYLTTGNGFPMVGLLFNYLQPPTFCRTMRAQELFSRLVGKLGGPTYMGYSVMTSSLLTATPTPGTHDEWVDLIPNDMKYTCGDAIRQLYTDGLGNPTVPKIVLSLRDFAKDVFTCLQAGIGIYDDSGTKKLICERLDYFFDTSGTAYDFGSRIANPILQPYNEHRDSTMLFGYEDVELDSVNGRYDAWSSQTYRTSLRGELPEGNYQSPFSASPLEIEITRANLANKQTTDSKQDNKVFKLVTESSSGTIDGVTAFRLNRTWTSMSGVPAEVQVTGAGGVFNVELSPAHNLVRLLPFLISNYGGNLAVQLLDPQTATKNRNFAAEIAWGLIGEFAQWDLLGTGIPAYWQPWLLTFDAEMPFDLVSIMQSSPYKMFGVTVNNVNVTGFVNRIGVVPGRNNSYTVQLILSPSSAIPGDL